MSKSTVGRDYLVGTVLVLLILAVSVLFIRLVNGVVEEEAIEGPRRIGALLEAAGAWG